MSDSSNAEAADPTESGAIPQGPSDSSSDAYVPAGDGADEPDPVAVESGVVDATVDGARDAAMDAGPSPDDGAAVEDGRSALEVGSTTDAGATIDATTAPDSTTVGADTDGATEADTEPTLDCSADAGGSIGASGAPALLGCTGLYSDWSSRTISPDAVAYDPGIHLWSDGAVKTRFIALPAGSRIDTSDMDEWTFPVGTKIWKQFAFGGKSVETRYLFKRGNSDWVYTTYQWSADQTTATELTTGATDVGGTGYEIPYLDECRTCHMGRLDFVLGFEAVALSTSQASGLTMEALVASGWVTDAPGSPIVIPGDATTSAALGWLHANCGTACHNASNYALAGSTGFFMRLDVADLATVETTDTYTTGVSVPATYVPPDGGTLTRIAPGDPAGSCVVFRAGYRDTDGEGIQMPPDDTHVVDAADLAVVASWITSL